MFRFDNKNSITVPWAEEFSVNDGLAYNAVDNGIENISHVSR
jgi:hypothetical protein